MEIKSTKDSVLQGNEVLLNWLTAERICQSSSISYVYQVTSRGDGAGHLGQVGQKMTKYQSMLP